MPRSDGMEEAAESPCAGEAIFSLRDLSFSHDGRKLVLDKINFSLAPGECVGLRGDNGAGKTTLFRCVAGLSKPQSGEVLLGSKIMAGEKDFRELRRHVGFTLQNAEDQLFFPSVLEDLSFGPLNLGLTAAEARERAEESLALVGLPGFGGRLGHQLSGGEKRLVALAAALAMRPQALLMDEPLTGLDMGSQRRVGEILDRLDCAKLIISHDHAFLDRHCGRQLLLEAGRLRPVGRP